MRMRLMLDLMGEDHRTSDYLAGLPASYARRIVNNVLPPLFAFPHSRDEPDVWIGVLVVKGPAAEEKPYTEWFLGYLADTANWMAAKVESNGQVNSKPVRIFMANASEAARSAREKALEIGAFDKAENIVVI